MKKLKKLEISPEKIMKNEELINLHGGYSGSECTEECFHMYCNATTNPNDRCRVTCGSTNCSFVAAVKK